MLVYLEPLDPEPTSDRPAPSPVLRLEEHGLSPAAVAVAAGGRIRIENDTRIYHRLFSASDSNPFDLGVFRRGEARSIDLGKPGVVRVYCSLHPSELAVVFVAPSQHFAAFRPPAAYEIREVPAGRYRLHAWGERGVAPTRRLTVAPGANVSAEVSPPAAAE